MNALDRQSEQGGAMLFVIIGMLFLSSAAFMLQSFLLPALSSGLDSLRNAQAEYLAESYQGILRARTGKNPKAGTLREALLDMNGETLAIPGPGTQTLGTVRADFTAEWYMTGQNPGTVLPKDAIAWMPGTGTYQMLAITQDGSVSRFDHAFGKANSTRLPAYAAIYFRCGRDNPTGPFSLDALGDDSPGALAIPAVLQQAFAKFSRVLPAADMLVGLLREDVVFVPPAERNAEVRTLLCTLPLDDGFGDVRTVYEGKDGDWDNLELFLGQHVEAKLTITPYMEKAFTRFWQFNGKSRFTAKR